MLSGAGEPTFGVVKMPVCLVCGKMQAHNYDLDNVKKLLDSGWILFKEDNTLATKPEDISDAHELKEKVHRKFGLGKCSFGYCPAHRNRVGDNAITR